MREFFRRLRSLFTKWQTDADLKDYGRGYLEPTDY